MDLIFVFLKAIFQCRSLDRVVNWRLMVYSSFDWLMPNYCVVLCVWQQHWLGCSVYGGEIRAIAVFLGTGCYSAGGSAGSGL